MPEECTLRGELLRKVADLLAPMIPDPGAAAATNGRQPRAGHAQAVARAGTLKTSTFYILLDEEERT